MRYALKNMFILSGHEDMAPETGKAILVEDGRIRAIVPEGEIPADFPATDLGGQYLLPGLINLHVHIPSSGKPTKKKTNYNALAALLCLAPVRAVIRAMCRDLAKQELLSGTTTIRAVGGVRDFDTALRDQINAGKVIGPRILAANYAVSVPGGHMTGSVALPANSPEEAAQMVRDLAKTRPDLIKLMITGGVLDAEVVGEPGILKMPPEYVKAAADEAHRLGYKVAAHVESTQGMLVALENGVDTVEHGGAPTDEVMALFHKTGSVLVATLSPAVPFTKLTTFGNMSGTDIINGKALFDHMVACIKACLAEKIPVGLGTDTGCPFITHYDMWRELMYFVQYIGVTPAFALYSATELNAKIAGLEQETGTVDAGKSADFMVVKRNPLEDLTALREPSAVVFRGDIIRDPKPKKMPLVEELLDGVMGLK